MPQSAKVGLTRRLDSGELEPVGLYQQCYGSTEEDLEWGGDYVSNEGQYVTPEDAAEIAAALESALEDGSSVESRRKILRYRAVVRDFIDYCWEGGFYIL